MTPPDTPSAEATVRGLIDLLDVEEIDIDLYRGKRLPGGIGRVFGGQVIAQALQAAQRSTDVPATPHSLHAYFMRAGDENYPIVYRVVRDFDGRSFATRRVIAMQRGKPILTMAASLQQPEEGLHHQDAMPDVSPPEDLPELDRPAFAHARPIEFRSVQPDDWRDPHPRAPVAQRWFRLIAPIGDDAAMHRAILAYASDAALMGTGLLPHGIGFVTPGFQGASLDHALWFHEPFRADEWLLYDTDSPWAGHARGFNRGRIFRRDGRLVASVAQEGLMRMRQPAPG